MAKRHAHPHRFLSAEEAQRVVDAIGDAEAKSHGEIRVHVEKRCKGGDPVARAKVVFEKLGMTRTELRCGALIYLATEHRLFAVIGDRGIHERVGDDFWTGAVAAMQQRFAAGEFAEGLVEAIGRIGDALVAHFPRDAGGADVDELPNEISFGDETAQ
ncbi:MAG: TPM domain-containing protein [bacterium]